MNQDSKILKSQTVKFLSPTPIASSPVPLPYPRNILCSYLMKGVETPCVLSRVRLCDPMDYSPPGSSVHGIFQARILEWGCRFLLQGIFTTKESNPGLLHCQQILYSLSHRGSPVNPVVISHLLVLAWTDLFLWYYVDRIQISLKIASEVLS